MALLVGARSSASNEIAQLLVQDIDLVRGQNREIQENLRQGTLTPQTLQRTETLGYQVNAMIRRLNRFETSIISKSSSAVDQSSQRVLTAQYDAFKGQVEELFHSSKYTLRDVHSHANAEFRKLFPVFEKAVAQYLDSRAIKDLAAAKEICPNVVSLARAVKLMSGDRNQWEGRRIEYGDNSGLLCERVQNLSLLIKVPDQYRPFESMMVELDQVMSGDFGADLNLSRRKWSALVDLNIDHLHKAVGTDQVNYWVWKLRGEQPEANYGLVHRYDDPDILKEAVRRTMEDAAPKLGAIKYFIQTSLDTYIPLAFEGYFDLCQGKNANRERMDQRIEMLHEAVGSDLVNYWVWKLGGEKPEANYGVVHRYDDLRILREAIYRTTQALADKIIEDKAGKLDRHTLLNALYLFLGEPQVANPSLWMEQNACFYIDELGRIDEDIAESIVNDRVMNRREEVKQHEFTQVLEQLDELGNQPITPELQKRVESMIAALSKNGLEDTINYEIWRLGGQKTGANWGVVHRYDDLNVLRQALMIAIRRDVHEQFVVKRFDNEADRNAFYVAMGKIAYPREYMIATDGDFFERMKKEFASIPTDDDFLEYGKKMIVFYLNHVELAAQAVSKSVE